MIPLHLPIPKRLAKKAVNSHQWLVWEAMEIGPNNLSRQRNSHSMDPGSLAFFEMLHAELYMTFVKPEIVREKKHPLRFWTSNSAKQLLFWDWMQDFPYASLVDAVVSTHFLSRIEWKGRSEGCHLLSYLWCSLTMLCVLVACFGGCGWWMVLMCGSSVMTYITYARY